MAAAHVNGKAAVSLPHLRVQHILNLLALTQSAVLSDFFYLEDD